MISTIYIEEEVRDHTRTLEICGRFPNASIVWCDRYSSVFNSNSQNFRLQKQQPSLILAKKHKGRVLSTPPGYGIGVGENYYFSHMMNCLYDCRYCFLQGMYRSAHYVVFVNYEDFFADISRVASSAVESSAVESDRVESNNKESCWFFSGYDCDSLAMEPVTGFIDACLEHFCNLQNAHLEVRTKSTQIRSLLNRRPIANCVIGYSFTAERTASRLEHKAPSVTKRIAALAKLQKHGWKVGLRLDPLIFTENFASDYRELLDKIFANIEPTELHSVSYGAFRLPKPFFKRMIALYPEERLFATTLTENNPVVSYPDEIEQQCLDTVKNLLTDRIDPSILFPCS